MIELTSAGTVPEITDGCPSIPPPPGAVADLSTATPSAAPAALPPSPVATGWPLDAAVNLLEPDGIPPEPIEPLVAALGREGAGALWGWLLVNPGLSLLQASAPHTLPAPPDKEARTRLHVAVLSLCPALCTRCAASSESSSSRESSVVSRQSSVVRSSRQAVSLLLRHLQGGRRVDQREWPARDRAAAPSARRGGRARAAALLSDQAERRRLSELRARRRARGTHAAAPAPPLRAIAQAARSDDAGG